MYIIYLIIKNFYHIQNKNKQSYQNNIFKLIKVQIFLSSFSPWNKHSMRDYLQALFRDNYMKTIFHTPHSMISCAISGNVAWHCNLLIDHVHLIRLISPLLINVKLSLRPGLPARLLDICKYTFRTPCHDKFLRHQCICNSGIYWSESTGDSLLPLCSCGGYHVSTRLNSGSLH